MYKYFFIVCVLIPLETYGYSLTKTDINKIKKTYAESAVSSICSNVCQQSFEQLKAIDECARVCLRAIVDDSINSLKSNAEKWRTGSVKICTTRLKITFPGKTLKLKEFNKLVQKCADQDVSKMITETINDFPSIITEEIQAQGGSQKAEQSMLRMIRQPAKASKNSQ